MGFSIISGRASKEPSCFIPRTIYSEANEAEKLDLRTKITTVKMLRIFGAEVKCGMNGCPRLRRALLLAKGCTELQPSPRLGGEQPI